MVGFNHTVLGGNRAALDQRQQIALYTFPGNIGAATAFTATTNLVDLIEKDNAILLCSLYRTGFDFFFIDQLARFFTF